MEADMGWLTVWADFTSFEMIIPTFQLPSIIDMQNCVARCAAKS